MSVTIEVEAHDTVDAALTGWSQATS